MNKIKRFFNALFNQDYVFSVVSKFMGVFIAVIYSIFFNRYLGAELKGESAIIQNYVSIISSIICLGMYQAYPFYKKKEKDVFYPFLNNMTSLYILIFIASLLVSLFVDALDMNIRVALVLMPVQAYIRHINYIVTIDRPKTRNIASILINLTDLAIVVALFMPMIQIITSVSSGAAG